MEKIIPLSLLPLDSSPCHCHSPFITQTLPTTNRLKKKSNTLLFLFLFLLLYITIIVYGFSSPRLQEKRWYLSRQCFQKGLLSLSLSLSLSLCSVHGFLYVCIELTCKFFFSFFSFFLGCGRSFQLQGWIYPVLGKCPR